jgi:hypothetical protein
VVDVLGAQSFLDDWFLSFFFLTFFRSFFLSFSLYLTITIIITIIIIIIIIITYLLTYLLTYFVLDGCSSCISVPAVDMFCVNPHACRELTYWLHMNRPNLHNAELPLTVAVRRQNVWSFPVVTRCYKQRTSERTESYLGVRIPFLISNFCRVLNVVCFLLGNSPASEFYMPTFRNTVCSIFIGG